jgi:hypothetical protein
VTVPVSLYGRRFEDEQWLAVKEKESPEGHPVDSFEVPKTFEGRRLHHVVAM